MHLSSGSNKKYYTPNNPFFCKYNLKIHAKKARLTIFATVSHFLAHFRFFKSIRVIFKNNLKKIPKNRFFENLNAKKDKQNKLKFQKKM